MPLFLSCRPQASASLASKTAYVPLATTGPRCVGSDRRQSAGSSLITVHPKMFPISNEPQGSGQQTEPR